MAHFARVQGGLIREVIVISNAVLLAIPGEPDSELPFPVSEPVGQEFIATLPALAGTPGEWKQCSYSASFRGVYPGSGFNYDAGLDEFVPPLPQAT